MKGKLHFYNIAHNVEAFSTTCGAKLPYFVVQSHQVHSDKVAIVRDPRTKREELEGFDALITNVRGCAIGARTADCVPILIFDPVMNVVASVHSGWRGTTLRVSQKTIRKMQDEFGCNPNELNAFIGPSISSKYFQIGEEVVEMFAESGFPIDDILSDSGTVIEGDITTGLHIDLWKANTYLLEEIGVKPENIHVSGICTYSNALFHSARREHNNKCERIINSIKLI